MKIVTRWQDVAMTVRGHRLLRNIALVLCVLAHGAAQAATWELNVAKASQAELVAATAIQGLANRHGAQVFLQTGDRDFMITFKNAEYGPGAEVANKFRSVDDAWKDYYTTRHGLKFEPVATLDELAAKVGAQLKGVVRYRDELPAAVTLAGLRNAVPVTDAVRDASPALQALPVLEDLRGRFKDRQEAHRWAVKELLPSCSQDGVFSITHGIDVVSLDLAVARKMFVYQLNHADDAALIGEILDHLHPISPVWGWGGPTEEQFLVKVSQHGAFVMCMQVPNVSFHEQIHPTQRTLQQRHVKPEDVTVEPKHYVAFMVNEGDTMKCAGSMMMCGSWLQPERGTLPINWGVNPYLCEQFPGLMEFYYSTMTTNDYFFDGPAGYGYIAPRYFPADQLFAFAAKTRAANKVADTRFAECWYFYPLQPEELRQRWLTALDLDGLTQWRGPQRISFPSPNCPPIIDSQHYYDKGTAAGIADELQREAEGAPRPWFTVVYGGSPRKFAQIARQLPAARFKIVRLDELFIAATKSRATIEKKIVKPAIMENTKP